MKIFLHLIPILVLVGIVLISSCTVTVTLTDTHGYANDVVDETTRTDAEVDPEISIPVKPF